MKTKLQLGDYVTFRYHVDPFLVDDAVKITAIVKVRGGINRIEVVRPRDKKLGWVYEDDIIPTERYL